MDKVKNITKSGWHPSANDGKKESWRGESKGINQVVRLLILSDLCTSHARHSLAG